MNYYSVKAFAVTIILFGISLCAIEYSIRHQFSRESYYTQAVIAAREAKVDCAVFGDSHGAAGFRDELQHCFNFAAGGMGLTQIIDSINSVRRQNNLSHVIMTFGPQLFSAERVNNQSAVFQSIGEDFTPLLNPLVLQPLMFDRWKVWFPQQLFNRTEKVVTGNSRHWGTLSEAQQQQAIALRLVKQTPLPDIQKSQTQRELRMMIEDLLQDGTKVCLVRTPLTAEYANALRPVLESSDWQTLLMQLRATGAMVVEYRQLKTELQDEHFSNEDHLNPDGAKQFASLAYQACFGSF